MTTTRIDYFKYAKVKKIELTHNGLIALCEDGSIYRVFYKDNNQDIEEVIIKPIYQTEDAIKYFSEINKKTVTTRLVFTNPGVKRY